MWTDDKMYSEVRKVLRPDGLVRQEDVYVLLVTMRKDHDEFVENIERQLEKLRTLIVEEIVDIEVNELKVVKSDRG